MLKNMREEAMQISGEDIPGRVSSKVLRWECAWHIKGTARRLAWPDCHLLAALMTLDLNWKEGNREF